MTHDAFKAVFDRLPAEAQALLQGTSVPEPSIMFGTLHPDGSVTDEVRISHATVSRCPNVILVPAHYDVAGVHCRCYVEAAPEMGVAGYTWDASQGVWS